MSSMRRTLVVIGLLVAVGGIAGGCSISTSASTTKATLPVCSDGYAGPVTTTKNGTGHTTIPPPCTSTTTTLPAALALGTPTELSYTGGSGPRHRS